jgi:phosphate acyltransferase
VQFAEMGAVYLRTGFGIAEPRVGVLTIGEEAGKGNDLVKAAVELLEAGSWAPSAAPTTSATSRAETSWRASPT